MRALRVVPLPLVLPFLVLGAAPGLASAEPPPADEPAPLKVRASDPELKRVRAATERLLGEFLMPCVQRQMQLKTPEDQIEQKCGCESAPAVNATIAVFEAVFEARPAWRGAPLQFKDADGSENTLRIEPPEKLKARLAACEGAGTDLQAPFKPSDLTGTWGGCLDEGQEDSCLTFVVPEKGAPTVSCAKLPLTAKAASVDPLGATKLVVVATDHGEKLTITFKGRMNLARDSITWSGEELLAGKHREEKSMNGVHAKGKTEPCK